MALNTEPHSPSGPALLVRRLPVAPLTLLGRLEHLAYAGLSSVRSDTRLRRGRTFARFAVATAVAGIRHHLPDSLASSTDERARDLLRTHLSPAAHELSRRLGRSPRPSELATLLGVHVDHVVEAVADDRRCFERPGGDPGRRLTRNRRR